MVALLRQLFENILVIIHHIDKTPHLFSTCDVSYSNQYSAEVDIPGERGSAVETIQPEAQQATQSTSIPPQGIRLRHVAAQVKVHR